MEYEQDIKNIDGLIFRIENVKKLGQSFTTTSMFYCLEKNILELYSKLLSIKMGEDIRLKEYKETSLFYHNPPGYKLELRDMLRSLCEVTKEIILSEEKTTAKSSAKILIMNYLEQIDRNLIKREWT